MATCDGRCRPECYACSLRAKAVHVSNEAIPNRLNNMRRTPPRTADPAWERGQVTERRPDGSRMPLLAPGTTRPMRVKEFAENRHGFEAQLQARSDPNVLAHERK